MHDQAAVGGYRMLLVAREFMRTQLAILIDKEAAAAAAGEPAAVCIKASCTRTPRFRVCEGHLYHHATTDVGVKLSGKQYMPCDLVMVC